MNRIILSLLLCCPLYSCLDSDQFSELELQKMGQSRAVLEKPKIPSRTIFLPVMTVSFDIMISDSTILYETPLFLLDGVPVVCQVCKGQPCQIEVTNGVLKCFCFQHIPRKNR